MVLDKIATILFRMEHHWKTERHWKTKQRCTIVIPNRFGIPASTVLERNSLGTTVKSFLCCHSYSLQKG